MLTAADPVVVGLAKDSDMGSKPILESTADVPESAIVIYVRRKIIEPLIKPCKARVDRVSSRAGEKTAAASENVGRQVKLGQKSSNGSRRRKFPVTTPAAPLPEPDLLKPLLSVIVTFPLESATPAPWTLTPAYFQGNQ